MDHQLTVPNIPTPIATDERLSMVAGLCGWPLAELRKQAWAGNEIVFQNLDTQVLLDLQRLLASFGVESKLESTASVAAAKAPIKMHDFAAKKPLQSFGTHKAPVEPEPKVLGLIKSIFKKS